MFLHSWKHHAKARHMYSYRNWSCPILGKSFLYFYENHFMTELISNNEIKAWYFHCTTSFIDDLCAINDNGEFRGIYAEIYTEGLELKLGHQDTHASFLNQSIDLVDRNFAYKLCDKRDSFLFSLWECPILIVKYLIKSLILQLMVKPLG